MKKKVENGFHRKASYIWRYGCKMNASCHTSCLIWQIKSNNSGLCVAVVAVGAGGAGGGARASCGFEAVDGARIWTPAHIEREILVRPCQYMERSVIRRLERSAMGVVPYPHVVSGPERVRDSSGCHAMELGGRWEEISESASNVFDEREIGRCGSLEWRGCQTLAWDADWSTEHHFCRT